MKRSLSLIEIAMEDVVGRYSYSIFVLICINRCILLVKINVVSLLKKKYCCNWTSRSVEISTLWYMVDWYSCIATNYPRRRAIPTRAARHDCDLNFQRWILKLMTNTGVLHFFFALCRRASTYIHESWHRNFFNLWSEKPEVPCVGYVRNPC